MEFKLDETFGRSVQRLFHDAGHDCLTVTDQGLRGAEDDLVLAAAAGEHRILVTMDQDFTNVLRFPPARTAGIAVLSIQTRISIALLQVLVGKLLSSLKEGDIRGRLWIVEPGRIRIYDPEDASG